MFNVNLNNISSIVAYHTSLRDHTQREYTRVVENLKKEVKRTIILNRTKELFEQLLLASREQVREVVSTIVTEALQRILDTTEVSFEIEFEFKRNQPEARPVLHFYDVSGSLEDSFGGGLDDVVSTVLKIVFKYLLCVEGPLFMDEPGKWIDSESSIRFVEFLRQLRERFNTQVFLATHKPEIYEAADKLFQVVNLDGESIVTEV